VGIGNIEVASGAAVEQMSGTFFAFDSKQRLLLIRDPLGMTFDFTLRDDSLLATDGTTSRLDVYLRSHLNNLSYSQDQQLRILWKPSTDGKKRVAISVQ
jgi:hypothetical protein